MAPQLPEMLPRNVRTSMQLTVFESLPNRLVAHSTHKHGIVGVHADGSYVLRFMAYLTAEICKYSIDIVHHSGDCRLAAPRTFAPTARRTLA